MTREEVYKELEQVDAYFRSSFDAMYGTVVCEKFRSWVDAIEHALALLKAQEPITGETSDGYHTFNELYHHRAVLFSVIVANYPDRAWKSKKHHDGTMYDNMFIVGIDTPDGQATYHYDVDPYWDMFKCRVLDNAPEWDGHTPAQAIERIGKLKAQEPVAIKPKRIDLEEETKAWLDKMDAVDALGTIADICIDWDGYRTADSLGGLINEIWAYARYCSNGLAKAQEPVEPKVIDTSNSRLYHNDMFKNYYCGNCGEFLHVVNRKDLFCSQCGRAVKWE